MSSTVSSSNSNLHRMTKKGIVNLCKKNKLYITPELNDVLYLHYQGYEDIECLEEYIGLKCLWLECNAISKISGLENQKQLRCLFLHNNIIKKIENLNYCTELDTINLSHNLINRIENLGIDILPVLSSLYLSHNYLRTYDNLCKLTECKMISVLDLSDNRIEDILVVKILAEMPNLKVLILQGNPVVHKIPQYRKTLILECKELTYLDQRPVFPRDRACAEAWKRGGYNEERKEHERWNKREHKKMRQNINATLRLRQRYQHDSSEILTIPSSSDDDDDDEDRALNRANNVQEAIEAKRILESVQKEKCSICKRIGCNISHKTKRIKSNRQEENEEDIMEDIFIRFNDQTENESNVIELQPQIICPDPEDIMADTTFTDFQIESVKNPEGGITKDVFVRYHGHTENESAVIHIIDSEDIMEDIFIRFNDQTENESNVIELQTQIICPDSGDIMEDATFIDFQIENVTSLIEDDFSNKSPAIKIIMVSRRKHEKKLRRYFKNRINKKRQQIIHKLKSIKRKNPINNKKSSDFLKNVLDKTNNQSFILEILLEIIDSVCISANN